MSGQLHALAALLPEKKSSQNHFFKFELQYGKNQNNVLT
jgi:hypothetical protein